MRLSSLCKDRDRRNCLAENRRNARDDDFPHSSELQLLLHQVSLSINRPSPSLLTAIEQPAGPQQASPLACLDISLPPLNCCARRASFPFLNLSRNLSS